jgi:hypothetical protein
MPMLAKAADKDTDERMKASAVGRALALTASMEWCPMRFPPLYSVMTLLTCCRAYVSARASYGTSTAQATTFQRLFSFAHNSSRAGDSSSPKLNVLADR